MTAAVEAGRKITRQSLRRPQVLRLSELASEEKTLAFSDAPCVDLRPKPSERQSRVERRLRMEICRLASERSLAEFRCSANLKQEPFSVKRRASAKH